MSKITKKELQRAIQSQETRIDHLVRLLAENGYYISNGDIERWESEVDNEPQLKQLDQSVFDGLDEKWRFAVIQNNGFALICTKLPFVAFGGSSWDWNGYSDVVGKGYDASNWQNSLIERDTAKEVLEVDLSSELTGSELCKAMLARGDKYVMCGVSDVSDLDAASNEYDDLMSDAVTDFDNKDGLFGTASMRWNHAVPINNQGEPLTAAEAGL